MASWSAIDNLSLCQVTQGLVSVAPSPAGRSQILPSICLPFHYMSGLYHNKLLHKCHCRQISIQEVNLNTVKTMTGDAIRNQTPVGYELVSQTIGASQLTLYYSTYSDMQRTRMQSGTALSKVFLRAHHIWQVWFSSLIAYVGRRAFITMRKAFDPMSHSILIWKLRNEGIVTWVDGRLKWSLLLGS